MSDQTVSAPTVTPPAPIGRGGTASRFLAQSIMLEESGPTWLIRGAILLIAAMVAAFLGWASVTTVDEVAVTSGEVMPAGSLQTVQHLDGGLVREIDVGVGDLVEKGDVLVRLDPVEVQAELEQLQAREVGLLMQMERLRAFAYNRAPEFRVPSPQFQDLADDQAEILQLQSQAQDSQRVVLQSQIGQREAELEVLAGQESSLKDQIKLLEEQVEMRTKLLAKGLTNRVIYLETQRELTRNQGELGEVVGQAATARQAIAEAEGRLLELDARLRNEAMQELGTVSTELTELREAIERQDARLERMEIRAPVRGLVQSVAINTIGAVIQPGDPVLEIVPIDDVLVVETRVSTEDIGHVRVGQPATVKVRTYEFTRYGSIDGEVTRLSATTFEDEQTGAPFYTARIRLAGNHVGADPERNLVLPGMTVTADIRTGEKSLLEYLVRPVYTALTEAFRER